MTTVILIIIVVIFTNHRLLQKCATLKSWRHAEESGRTGLPAEHFDHDDHHFLARYNNINEDEHLER